MWASVTDGRPTLTQPWFQVVVIEILNYVQCQHNKRINQAILLYGPSLVREKEQVEESIASTMTRAGQ